MSDLYDMNDVPKLGSSDASDASVCLTYYDEVLSDRYVDYILDGLDCEGMTQIETARRILLHIALVADQQFKSSKPVKQFLNLVTDVS